MENAFTFLASHYRGDLSLLSLLFILGLTLAEEKFLKIIPTIKRARNTDRTIYDAKMAKPNYVENQKWNRKWSSLFIILIFSAFIPFGITDESQTWWRVVRDMVAILMFYDFFYYLTHRFVFHNGGPFAGPLLWMHAVHHRQHNPCRGDSSYIHPLEVAIGLGLYVGSILLLSVFLGKFHVVTIVTTWIVFTSVNLHNHTRWNAKHFPFGYLDLASELHHHHHARFTGGNFATISPLYDWLFGTLDRGNGYRAEQGKRAR